MNTKTTQWEEHEPTKCKKHGVHPCQDCFMEKLEEMPPEPQTGVEEMAQKIQDLYFHSGAKISKATWDKTLELVSQAKQEGAREERERIRKEISNALWNKDGSLKSHDVSYIVSTAIHKTLSNNT